MMADLRNKTASWLTRLGWGGVPQNRETSRGWGIVAAMRGLAARASALLAGVRGMPRPSMRTLAVLGVTVLLMIISAEGVRHRRVALDVVQEHPYFQVEHIVVRGTGSLVSESALREWLGVREGDSLWKASPEVVEARLEAHPMLRAAVVRRVFPSTLDIRVRERRPAAITVLDDLYYLDRNGESFGPLGPGHGRDFPVFTGVAEGAGGQRHWTLRRALRLLRRSKSTAVDFEISEVHLDPDDGLVLYPADPRVPIYLGWKSWERRLPQAIQVLTAWRDSTGSLARVDLRFRDQVVVGLREPRGIQLSREHAGQVST